MREGELADRVAECLDRVGVDVLDRVDAEAVEVVARDQVVVRRIRMPSTGNRPRLRAGPVAGRGGVVFDHQLARAPKVADDESAPTGGDRVAGQRAAPPKEVFAL